MNTQGLVFITILSCLLIEDSTLTMQRNALQSNEESEHLYSSNRAHQHPAPVDNPRLAHSDDEENQELLDPSSTIAHLRPSLEPERYLEPERSDGFRRQATRYANMRHSRQEGKRGKDFQGWNSARSSLITAHELINPSPDEIRRSLENNALEELTLVYDHNSCNRPSRLSISHPLLKRLKIESPAVSEIELTTPQVRVLDFSGCSNLEAFKEVNKTSFLALEKVYFDRCVRLPINQMLKVIRQSAYNRETRIWHYAPIQHVSIAACNHCFIVKEDVYEVLRHISGCTLDMRGLERSLQRGLLLFTPQGSIHYLSDIN